MPSPPPQNVSLSTLSHDLLYIILQYSSYNSPRDLFSLASTTRNLYTTFQSSRQHFLFNALESITGPRAAPLAIQLARIDLSKGHPLAFALLDEKKKKYLEELERQSTTLEEVEKALTSHKDVMKYSQYFYFLYHIHEYSNFNYLNDNRIHDSEGGRRLEAVHDFPEYIDWNYEIYTHLVHGGPRHELPWAMGTMVPDDSDEMMEQSGGALERSPGVIFWEMEQMIISENIHHMYMESALRNDPKEGGNHWNDPSYDFALEAFIENSGFCSKGVFRRAFVFCQKIIQESRDSGYGSYLLDHWTPDQRRSPRVLFDEEKARLTQEIMAMAGSHWHGIPGLWRFLGDLEGIWNHPIERFTWIGRICRKGRGGDRKRRKFRKARRLYLYERETIMERCQAVLRWGQQRYEDGGPMFYHWNEKTDKLELDPDLVAEIEVPWSRGRPWSGRSRSYRRRGRYRGYGKLRRQSYHWDSCSYCSCNRYSASPTSQTASPHSVRSLDPSV